MLWMTEIKDRSPDRTFRQFAGDIFDTCRDLTTTYLLVFVVGNTMLALSPFNVTSNLQFLVIKLPNLLAGIDSMTTYLSLSLGIYIFQKCLINKNWRIINYGSGACVGAWIDLLPCTRTNTALLCDTLSKLTDTCQNQRDMI